MSKKNVLNEVRRFMKLANLDANMSSNFITKIEEGEMPSYLRDDEGEEMEDEIDVEADVDIDDGVEIEDEVEVEMDVDVEEEAVITDEEADILIALGQKLAAAQELGAEEEVEDALDDLDAADELEADAEEAEVDAAEDLEDAAEDLMQEDETLEEILDSILHEDSGEEEGRHYEDDEEADRKHLAALKKDIRYDDDHIDEEKDPNWGGNKGDYKRRKDAKGVRKKVGDKDHHYKDYMEEDQGYDDKEDESLGMRRGKEADKKQSEKDRRDDSYGKWGSRNQRDRMRNRKRDIPKLRNEDAVVQEVLKRVRARLAQMAKK
tara:strand:+ start:9281 stop:10240 length:960 start_codon:yes stop_codon:yes gene_type:complete